MQKALCGEASSFVSSQHLTKVRVDGHLVFLGLWLCLENPPDTVGELKSAEVCVSYLASLKAKKLGKLTQEKVVLEHRSWVGCERGPFGLFSQPPAEPDVMLVASSGSPVSL